MTCLNSLVRKYVSPLFIAMAFVAAFTAWPHSVKGNAKSKEVSEATATKPFTDSCKSSPNLSLPKLVVHPELLEEKNNICKVRDSKKPAPVKWDLDMANNN